MGEDDRRRKELVKTTGTGKPSKGSIDWMRAQGIDVREYEAELAAIECRLAPLAEEAETIDAMLAPYRVDQGRAEDGARDAAAAEGRLRSKAHRRAERAGRRRLPRAGARH